MIDEGRIYTMGAEGVLHCIDLKTGHIFWKRKLLDEFKVSTQFIVITHNPRTMQSADAVYGVTMQEPGVSTIVGVRLGENVAA